MSVYSVGSCLSAAEEADFDLRDRILLRRQQKMSLGRYGRQSFSYWDKRPSYEIDWAIGALDKVIERERTESPEDM